MSSIVYLKNKKTGKTYAYLNESVWDKDKKKCICKRKCIGHLDPETGDILPNRQRKEKESATIKSVGFSMLFEQTCEKIGLSESLRMASPKNWKRILTGAQYILSEGNCFTGCEHWSEENLCLSNDVLSVKNLRALLNEIDVEVQQRFFKDWIERQNEKDTELMNTVSISSVNEGNNRLRTRTALVMEDLSKLGLYVIVGSKKRLPLYFQVSPGGMMGASALSGAAESFGWSNKRNMDLIVDRAFVNEESLEYLYRNRNRFIARTYPEFSFSSESIVRVRDRIMSLENSQNILGKQLFVMSLLGYIKGHKCYTHIFFDSQESESQFITFLGLVDDCYNELRSGELVEEHSYFYEKYFYMREAPEGGRIVELNSDAMMKYNDVAGFSVLLSSHKRSPEEALNSYREKDRVESMFDNIRNEEDNASLRLYMESAMSGRLFLQFIALIVSSEIWRMVSRRPALSEYTLKDIVEEMSKIKRIFIPGQKTPMHTKITKKQMEIMGEFGVDLLLKVGS